MPAGTHLPALLHIPVASPASTSEEPVIALRRALQQLRRSTVGPFANQGIDVETNGGRPVGLFGDVDVGLADVFDQHGQRAYRVAMALTQDAELAQRAVIAAFVELAGDPGTTAVRPLHVEVLDAVRRCAGPLGPHAGPVASATGDRPVHVYRLADPAVRDALALAVAGRCSCGEIADIMGLDTTDVRRHLATGLRQLVALVDAAEPSH